MKNCPWFSLRSNSIESRSRSILRGNFLVDVLVTLRKSKSNSEFASLIKLFYSLRSIQIQFSACDFHSFRLHSLKKRFFRESRCEFCKFARRHSLWIYWRHSNCTDTDKNEPYLFQHFASESQKHTSSLATFCP